MALKASQLFRTYACFVVGSDVVMGLFQPHVDVLCSKAICLDTGSACFSLVPSGPSALRPVHCQTSSTHYRCGFESSFFFFPKQSSRSIYHAARHSVRRMGGRLLNRAGRITPLVCSKMEPRHRRVSPLSPLVSGARPSQNAFILHQESLAIFVEKAIDGNRTSSFFFAHSLSFFISLSS